MSAYAVFCAPEPSRAYNPFPHPHNYHMAFRSQLRLLGRRLLLVPVGQQPATMMCWNIPWLISDLALFVPCGNCSPALMNGKLQEG